MNDRLHPAARRPDTQFNEGLFEVGPRQAAAIQVDRACAELRCGRPLALRVQIGLVGRMPGDSAAAPQPHGWLLVAAVETLGEDLLRRLAHAGASLQLLLSTERLRAMGWPAASTPRAMALPAGVLLAQLQQLAAVTPGGGDRSVLGDGEVADETMHAALSLCKRARLMPALVVLGLPTERADLLDAARILKVDPLDVALAVSPVAGALRRVSDAQVPLEAHEDCTLVLFREVDGDADHVAIIVGQPNSGEPVPVRLHSSCLTGDLLGSLRCDCGPQLQCAIECLAETGGVLLYMAQEGRGTGLANKLRAYRLQDGGLDTLQADRHLGFREDERNYEPAAAMLRELGYTRIRLLTNNPGKIEALRHAGVEVVERLPLHAPINRHNARYIRTKQTQAGHLGADD